jgi:dolichyl-phosphate beta-glucosyltransferase
MTLSVIIPTFNSASFIAATFREMLAFLADRGEDYEVIFVDDGSRDDTPAVLENLLRGQPRARLIGNGANRGKGHAVRLGMKAAQGEFLVFTDADLAYPPAEIDKILDTLKEGADLAIATRVAPESRCIMSPKFFNYLYTRHLGSRLFNWVVRKSLSLPIHDTQAGLKGFNRKATDLIFDRQTLEGFTFDVELIYIAHRLGLKIQEVPVVFQYFSEPTTISFIRQSLASLKDLIFIRSREHNGVYR